MLIKLKGTGYSGCYGDTRLYRREQCSRDHVEHRWKNRPIDKKLTDRQTNREDLHCCVQFLSLCAHDRLSGAVV